MRGYGKANVFLALLTVGLGIALLAATFAQGGGTLGIILGSLFIVAGGGRLYLGRFARGGRQ